MKSIIISIVAANLIALGINLSVYKNNKWAISVFKAVSGICEKRTGQSEFSFSFENDTISHGKFMCDKQ